MRNIYSDIFLLLKRDREMQVAAAAADMAREHGVHDDNDRHKEYDYNRRPTLPATAPRQSPSPVSSSFEAAVQ